MSSSISHFYFPSVSLCLSAMELFLSLTFCLAACENVKLHFIIKVCGWQFLSFSQMSLSKRKSSKLKCRQIRQDEMLWLIAFDVLLRILLQVELHMNETRKEVTTTAEEEVFL